MSCCAGKSQQANSTIPFRYGRLNYNHFQTGGITTESWSLSEYKMPENHTWYTYLP